MTDNYITSARLRALAELVPHDDVVELTTIWIRRMYEMEIADPLITTDVSVFPLLTILPIRDDDVCYTHVCEVETALVARLKQRRQRGLTGAMRSRYLSVLVNHHERSTHVAAWRRCRTPSRTITSLFYIATSGIGGMSLDECFSELTARADLSILGAPSPEGL